ncbi:hypothetical protein DSO57_1024201 [Entomophthora muscae]|uniref:Uncharacterized protein n=1 Tax=Entomophthora muscae TaxID=34485 RepID=A0ACC2SFE1_9FUNG|nr:hypothetical protein DSO57_1024201 [Entomophthora muscae]
MEYQFKINHIPEKMDEEMKYHLKIIFDFLAFGIIPEHLKKSNQFFVKCSKYTTVGNKMYKKAAASLLWIPLPSQHKLVLQEAHKGSGHYGQQTTPNQLKHGYW